MILLQIFAGILLLPLFLVMVPVFNIQVKPRYWHLCILPYGMLVSAAVGLLFRNTGFAAWAIVIYLSVYILRMYRLNLRLREKEAGKPYPILTGACNFKKSRYRITFLMPITLIKLAGLMPDFIGRELSKKSGLKINIRKLIPLVLSESRGTEIIFHDKAVDLRLNIE